MKTTVKPEQCKTISCVSTCVCVCVHVCVCVDELNYTCHCSGVYDTHISSKVMLISMYTNKN